MLLFSPWFGETDQGLGYSLVFKGESVKPERLVAPKFCKQHDSPQRPPPTASKFPPQLDLEMSAHTTHSTHTYRSSHSATVSTHASHITHAIHTATTGVPTGATDQGQAVSASSSAAAAVGASHGHGLSDADALTHNLITQVTCIVFGLIGLAILLRLPSLINFVRSRYGRPVLQVLSGSGSSKGSAATFNGGPGNMSRMSSFESYSSSGSMKEAGFSTGPAGLIALNLRGDLVDRNKIPPRRISWVPSALDPVVNMLRVRVMPGYMLGQFLLLLGYTCIMFYGTFTKSNPLKDGTRTAWVAVCPLPLVFALAQKNNVLGSLLGYGYEVVSLASFSEETCHSLAHIYSLTSFIATLVASLCWPAMSIL